MEYLFLLTIIFTIPIVMIVCEVSKFVVTNATIFLWLIIVVILLAAL